MVTDSVDAYIAGFPGAIGERLAAIRSIILAAAPDATEVISYGMPTYQLNGTLVHMAAFTNHIGLYAAWPGDPALQQQCARYASGKGTLQFPHRQALPLALIREIVLDRVQTQRTLA